MNKKTLLLVDDHPVYLEGFTHVLHTLFDNITLLLAENAHDALRLATDHLDIDYIFVDYQLPDQNGLALLKQLNDMLISAPVILVSGADNIDVLHEAMTLGASGFIHKGSNRNIYQTCLATIEQGNTFLTPEHRAKLTHHQNNIVKHSECIQRQLSIRRKEVLVLIAEGYSNAEIAHSLHISESTVKSHVSALLDTFDADNRSHCVAEAQRLRLIQCG